MMNKVWATHVSESMCRGEEGAGRGPGVPGCLVGRLESLPKGTGAQRVEGAEDN